MNILSTRESYQLGFQIIIRFLSYQSDHLDIEVRFTLISKLDTFLCFDTVYFENIFSDFWLENRQNSQKLGEINR